MARLRDIALAVAALALTLGGCARGRAGDEGVTNTDHGRYACAVEPHRITLADGTVYDCPEWVPVVPQGTMTYTSAQPVVDALYAIEATEEHYAVYTDAIPFSALLLPNDDAVVRALESVSAEGFLAIPGEGDDCYWPVSSQRLEWLMGAAETVRASADKMKRLRLQLLANAILADDRDVRFAPAEEAVRGIPSYLLHPLADFPQWMGNTERFMSMSATTNLAYRAAKMIVSPDACDTLRRSIVKHFWVPSLGGFSPIVYGPADGAYPIQLQATDNVASALGVLTGATSQAMTAAIFAGAPITPEGIPVTYPTFDHADTMAPTVHALWMTAAARSDNRIAYESAASHVIADAVRSHGRGEKSMSALIVRGLLGADFTDQSLRFAPFVPRWLPGEKHIGNFRYGNAIFDITLNGTGNYITTFTLDGHVAQPLIPSSVTGHHTIAITVTGDPNDNDNLHLSDTLSLPRPPTVEWGKEDEGVAKMFNPTRYDAEMTVYLDGVNLDGISDGKFSVIPAPDNFSSVQITTTLEGRWSTFSCAPRVTFPHSSVARINLLRLAHTGSRIIENKRVAARFVETGRWKNREITFEHSVPFDADYIFDVHYLNGLGIVNPTRKFALRSLTVDGRRVGTMFFPQLPRSFWKPSADWQLSTGFSTALTAHLSRGNHRITIAYYEPAAHLMSEDMNTVLMDYMRIIRK